MPELVQNMIVLIITTVPFDMCKTSFIRKRKSQNLTVCPRGKDLLELCIEANLSILNGKAFGDMLGKYT